MPVLAEIGAHGVVAGPDPSLLSQPSNAIAKALAKAGKTPAEVDLFEINEAFASVAIQSMRDLGIDASNVNVNGGAISMGHPVGASGARIALHLAIELAPPRRRAGRGRAVRRRRPGRGPAPARGELRGETIMADMNGQVALVTGGVRGIGRAIGERLAARGVTVAAGYSRGKEAADAFVADHPGRQRASGQRRLQRGLRTGHR